MKKVILVTLIVGLLVFTGMAAKTIGFAVSTLANPFFVTMKEGGLAKAAELGLNMIVLDAQDSPERQFSQVQDLITRRVDVLIINPVDSDAIVPAVLEANAAKIPVITVTRPSRGGVVAQHLDIDNKEAGMLAAIAMATALNGTGKVAILEGIPGAPSAVDRQAGFVNELKKYPGIEIVASLTANYSREQGSTVAEDILQGNPVLNGIYAHNDQMALGAVRAAVAAGRLGELKIVGIDAIDDAQDAIRAGEMIATVQQQPALQMAMAVVAAQRIINGASVEPKVIIPLKLITIDTLK